MYQIVIPIICAVLILNSFRRFITREKNYSLLKLLLRIVVWGGLAAITLMPEMSVVIAEIIGIQDNINALVLLGFVLVFVTIFKLLNLIEAQERTITKLVREIALKDITEN